MIAEALAPLVDRLAPLAPAEVTMRLGHLLFSLPLPPCRAPRDYRVGSMRLAGPVGVAAGLDKNGRMARFLSHFCPGFVVVGSTTPRPRRGNRPPRVARLAPHSMVNAMGLNNDGLPAVLSRVSGVDYPLLVSVAGFSELEILEQLEYIERYAGPNVVGVEVNLSSPTYKGMWRGVLPELGSYRRQVLLKVGPGFDLEEYAAAARRHGLGLVVTNTLPVDDPRLSTGRGGLSGLLLYPLALAMVRRAREAAGDGVPIVGVGGIMTCSQAREMMRYADALEVLTAVLYLGPGVLRRLNSCLAWSLSSASRGP